MDRSSVINDLIHSDHGSISNRFRDERGFRSKIAHSPALCVPNAPAAAVPIGIL